MPQREITKIRPLLITGPDPRQLQRLLTREHRRGTLRVRTDIIEIQPGVWGAEVTRLRPIRPRWVRPAAVTSAVVGGLAGLTGLGWGLSSLVVMGSAATAGGAAVVGLLLVLLLRRLISGVSVHSPRSCCRVDVRVTHRH